MYQEHLTALEDTFGVPIILIASRWRAERAVDLDRQAARIVLEIFDGLPGEYDRHPEQLGLFLVGQGGRPAFVNSVFRMLEGYDVSYRCFVPGVVNGAYTLLALGAEEIVLHPYGGLGAYDAPPARRLSGRLDLETIEALRPRLLEDEETPAGTVPRLAQLAHLRTLSRQQLERVVGGTDEGTGARVAREMTVDRLGRELALGARELESLGVSARRADEVEREMMWQLHQRVESDLGLRGPVSDRYTEAELAEEVEFEPAEEVSGAVIESANHSAIFELDTGNPDPDTNMYKGHWTEVERLDPVPRPDESEVQVES